jgi:hypothetical protein
MGGISMQRFLQFMIFSIAITFGGYSHVTFAELVPHSSSLSFEEWSLLESDYFIKSFDGQVIYDGRESVIEVENNRYKSANGTSLTFLNLKLYDEYSSSGSHRWNFGPFKEIGKSSFFQDASGITYSYECFNETVIFQGNARQFSLKLTVKQLSGTSDIEISYDLKFEGAVSSINHKFVLEKI